MMNIEETVKEYYLYVVEKTQKEINKNIDEWKVLLANRTLAIEDSIEFPIEVTRELLLAFVNPNEDVEGDKYSSVDDYAISKYLHFIKRCHFIQVYFKALNDTDKDIFFAKDHYEGLKPRLKGFEPEFDQDLLFFVRNPQYLNVIYFDKNETYFEGIGSERTYDFSFILLNPFNAWDYLQMLTSRYDEFYSSYRYASVEGILARCLKKYGKDYREVFLQWCDKYNELYLDNAFVKQDQIPFGQKISPAIQFIENEEDIENNLDILICKDNTVTQRYTDNQVEELIFLDEEQEIKADNHNEVDIF